MSSGSRRTAYVSMSVVAIVAVVLLLTPAGAHVTDSVTHLWTDHIKPLATKTFFTKAQSDGRYVRTGATRTGYASCPAAAFEEDSSSQGFALLANGMRYDPTGGGGIFACNAALPHGATVKAVNFTFLDSSPTDSTGCDLNRVDLTTGGSETMASAFPASESADVVRVTSTNITSSRVNANKYAYALTCTIIGDGTDIGFFGGSVRYTLTGAAGAAN